MLGTLVDSAMLKGHSDTCGKAQVEQRSWSTAGDALRMPTIIVTSTPDSPRRYVNWITSRGRRTRKTDTDYSHQLITEVYCCITSPHGGSARRDRMGSDATTRSGGLLMERAHPVCSAFPLSTLLVYI